MANLTKSSVLALADEIIDNERWAALHGLEHPPLNYWKARHLAREVKELMERVRLLERVVEAAQPAANILFNVAQESCTVDARQRGIIAEALGPLDECLRAAAKATRDTK